MEKWQDEPIPFDDIDTHALYEATLNLFPKHLLDEEEDGGIPISSSTIGAKIFKDRKLLKERTWSDLGIYERFLQDTLAQRQRDETMLKPVYLSTAAEAEMELDPDSKLTIADFLSNGYDLDEEDMDHETCPSPDMVNDSMIGIGDRERGEQMVDLSLNSTSDLIGPSSNSFNMNIRSSSTSSTNNNPIQTPRPPRTRQLSQDRNFQTPITRIIR